MNFRDDKAVLKVVNALTAEEREKVEVLVRRHVEASKRIGAPIEFLDRVYLEAVEAVKNGDYEEIDKPWPDLEPAWAFGVYVSPKAA